MIKNLVFDMGDVLLSYRWREMIEEFGLEGEALEDFWYKFFQSGYWKEFDRGTYNAKEYYDLITGVYPEVAPCANYLLENMDQMPLPRKEVWEKVSRLKAETDYKLFVLSNYPMEMFRIHTAMVTCLKDMDGIVVSGDIHLIKPNREIYEHLLNTYHLNPDETMFYDDRQDNIDGALAVGMHGTIVESEEFLLKELDRLLAK